jgi:hypothetical protein
LELKFDEETLKPVVIQDDTETASMEQRAILGGLDSLKFGGMKVGTALVGGSVASLLSDTVDGVVGGTGLLSAVAKLGIASFLLPALKGFVGSEGIASAQMFVAYDVVRQVLPIDNLIRQATSVFGAKQLQYAPSSVTQFGGQTGEMLGEVNSLSQWASTVGGN